MLLNKILTAIQTVSDSDGVSKYDVQELDSDLGNILLQYVNLQEFSKYRVFGAKDKLITSLKKLYDDEKKVSCNVTYIVDNMSQMRDLVEKIKSVQDIYDTNKDKLDILLDGGLTGSELSGHGEPWFETIEKYSDNIRGVLTLQQEELLDTLLDAKEELPYTIYGSRSLREHLSRPELIIQYLTDTIKTYEQSIIKNPLQPEIYSTDLIWLTQHTKPLNLIITKFLSEFCSN